MTHYGYWAIEFYDGTIGYVTHGYTVTDAIDTGNVRYVTDIQSNVVIYDDANILESATHIHKMGENEKCPV